MVYENHVYLAKLAEQAERYEGKASLPIVQSEYMLKFGLVQRWWKT